MDRNVGVYAIINQVNGKMYIGSSRDLKGRRNDHFNRLRKNKHDNIYLQYAFNKYKEQTFKFEIIKYCNINKLFKWEQYFMNKYNTCNQHCGYNMALKADRPPMTEETKRKIGDANRGHIMSKEQKEFVRKINIGNKNHLGYKWSNETREKNIKYKHLVKEWIELYNQEYSLTKISKLYNVSTGTINRYLFEYHKIKKRKQIRKYEHLVKEWKELRKQGLSHNAIGKKYNIGTGEIIRYLVKYYPEDRIKAVQIKMF